MEDGGLRIIVVDDDALMLRILRPHLEEHAGAEVLVATTPEAALEALPAPPRPVAVVADFNLRASLNGLQLLAAVARSHPHATRILMSGYSAEQIGIRGTEPIHAFVEKDLRLEKVAGPILRTLRARHPPAS